MRGGFLVFIHSRSFFARSNAWLLKAAFLVLLGASVLISNSAWAQAKIGFVRTERVLKESVPAQAAQRKLETEFSKREKELQDLASRLRGLSEKLERDLPVLAEKDRVTQQREITDMERDLQRRQREFREDLNQRRNEELAGVVEQANQAIRKIAESEKYDVIFQEAVYASPRIDITDKVLRALGTKASGK
jgi:outer membrane protein